MSDWSQVRRSFEKTACAERVAWSREQAVARAERELTLWYERVDALIMGRIADSLERRASELRLSGASVQVFYLGVSSIGSGAGAVRRSLRLVFSAAEVSLYSTRSSQGPLMVHWAWLVKSPRARFARVLSVPGFRVRRGTAQQILLEPVGLFASTTPLQPEDVACHLLSMLAEMAAARVGNGAARSSSRT